MQLKLYSWNGIRLDLGGGTNLDSYFEQGQQLVPVGNPIYTKRYGTNPFLGGSVLSEVYFTIVIELKGTIHSQRQTVKQYFNTSDQTPRILIATDSADTNRPWYLKAIPKQVTDVKGDQGRLYVTLATYEPYWRLVTPSSDTKSITATGQTKALTVIGSTWTRPIITITPTSVKIDGYQYQRWVAIKNVVARAFNDYPIDITFGGWNTAAVVTATHMQADGDDLRTVMDGQEVDRWFGGGGINSTTTTVWINVDLSPAANPVMLGAHNNAVTTLNFKKTIANFAALKVLAKAPNMVLYVGTEAITFTSVNLVEYQIAGCVRGAKGTSAAAHSDGDICYWIEHDIWVTYGNSVETAPSIDDNYKPMLDLTNSTNTLWKYTDYWIRGLPRTAKFLPHKVSALGPDSTLYTKNHQTFEDNDTPASEMGMSIQAFKRSNIWKAETALMLWQLYNPAGMTTVNVTGEKYRGSSVWPKYAGLDKSTNGVTWTNVWTEVTPASITTWTAVANTGDKALTTTQYYIRFLLAGSVNAVADNVANLEIDAVAVTLDSNGVPVGVFAAEQTARYYIDCKITNNTTGDYLRFKYPGYLNKAFTLNCDTRTLTWFDGSRISVSIVNADAYNNDWLRMAPGTNTIQYDETNAAGLTLGFSWEDREFL